MLTIVINIRTVLPQFGRHIWVGRNVGQDCFRLLPAPYEPWPAVQCCYLHDFFCLEVNAPLLPTSTRFVHHLEGEALEVLLKQVALF